MKGANHSLAHAMSFTPAIVGPSRTWSAEARRDAKRMTIPVLLMECPVAGFQYHEGEISWKELRVGQTLALIREPGNRHDARAIRVQWRDVILGYMPREAKFAVAQLLDRGEQVEGRISLLRESGDPWQRVMMQLVLHASAARSVPDPAPSLEYLLLKDLKAWLAAKDAIKRARSQS